MSYVEGSNSCDDYAGHADLAEYGCMYCDNIKGSRYVGVAIFIMCMKGHTMALDAVCREVE